MKILVFVIGCLTLLSGCAAYQDAGQVLNQIYGAQSVGCTQTSVTTTGHNRSGPYTSGRRYKIYGYNGSTLAGDTIKCAQGTVAVDVTSLAGSKVGSMIFSGNPESWKFADTNLYLSCISATATMKYDVCPLGD